MALNILARDVLGLEPAKLKRLPEVSLFKALQGQEGGHRAVITAGSPVGVLEGVDIWHKSPGRRYSSASRLQGAVDLGGGRILVP